MIFFMSYQYETLIVFPILPTILPQMNDHIRLSLKPIITRRTSCLMSDPQPTRSSCQLSGSLDPAGLPANYLVPWPSWTSYQLFSPPDPTGLPAWCLVLLIQTWELHFLHSRCMAWHGPWLWYQLLVPIRFTYLHNDMILSTLGLNPHGFIFGLYSKGLMPMKIAFHLISTWSFPCLTNVGLWLYFQYSQ